MCALTSAPWPVKSHLSWSCTKRLLAELHKQIISRELKLISCEIGRTATTTASFAPVLLCLTAVTNALSAAGVNDFFVVSSVSASLASECNLAAGPAALGKLGGKKSAARVYGSLQNTGFVCECACMPERGPGRTSQGERP